MSEENNSSSTENTTPPDTNAITERTEERVVAAERTTSRRIPIPRELANPTPPPPREDLLTERQFIERLQGRIGQAMTNMISNVLSPMSPMGGAGTALGVPRITEPFEPTKEDIQQVDGILARVENNILEQARRLLRVEIRENLLNAANLPRLRELIRSGKKIKFVRKRTPDRDGDRGRDPLFIVFGEGIEEGDEIEEFLIAR